MKLSLKLRVMILLLGLTLIPILLYLYHSSSMREEIIKSRLNFMRVYASAVLNRLDLFLEKVKSDVSSQIILYRGLGFSEEEILWRITGSVKPVFEGAYYTPEGIRTASVSRETDDPRFPGFVNVKDLIEKQEFFKTPYGEPYLRFVVADLRDGRIAGYYLFSLDISLLWQEIVSTRPSPDAEVLLTDRSGKVLAFSDLRFFREQKVSFREGVVRSDLSGMEVLRSFVKGQRWTVVIEEPLVSVLDPLYSFQSKALIAGSLFTLGSGIFALTILFRIFKPLEDLRLRILSWEREYMKKPIKRGDEVSELSQAFEMLVRKIEEEKKLYTSLFENTLDCVLVFNHEGRVVDANKKFLEEFSLSKEEVQKLSMEQILGCKLSFSRFFFSERKVYLGGRGPFFWEILQIPLTVEGKKYYLWRVRNISKEKELEVLLERTAKLSLAGEIACSIAHQLNNPLASVMGYAESIVLTSNEEETRKKAEVILKHARKCSETVKKLLEIGKPFEGEPKRVSVSQITMEAVSLILPKAKKKGVRIEVKDLSEGVHIFTFPWQLEQILVNLIDNAVDASPEGGLVEVILEADQGYVKWAVKDSGHGIDPSEIEKIFDPFYTTKESGTGLGLAVVKRFVENLGGKVKIEPHPQGGTVAQVIFFREVSNS